jgi:hypothetical protein
MDKEDIISKVRGKFERLSGVLDERGRRVWAAAEAEAIGYGGQSIVAKATGLSRVTLHREETEKAQDLGSSLPGRIRKAGGGRKKLTRQGPGLLSALEALVEPTTRGDPESPLRWTCRSTRQLADALAAQGYRVSHQTVASLLGGLGYSLQGNQKDQGRLRPPGSGRPVPVYPRAGRGFPAARATGRVCGHQEKGTRRGFQERRAGMASQG